MISLEKKEKLMSYGLPLLGGVLYPFGFPMKFSSGFFLFSILGFFFYLNSLDQNISEGKGLKKALLSLLSFSLGYALVGYYWIPYTLNVFGNIPFPINTLLGAMFSLIIVPHLLFFLLLIHFSYEKGQIKQLWQKHKRLRILLLSFLLVLFENLIPQQFPAHLGHSWFSLNPYLGLSTYFGASIFSFISYWSIWEIIEIRKDKKLNPVWIISLLVFSVLLFITPLKKFKGNPKEILNTRFVQANVGNFLKIDSEKGGAKSMREIYERYSQLSKKESISFEGKPDLIIWPETSYPQLLNTSMMRVSPAFIPGIVRNTITETGAYLFFGGYDKSGEENKNYYETEYNAAFLIDPNNQVSDVYHKRLLIPFGESLPFGPLNPLFAGMIQNLAFFAKGERFTHFELNNGPTFISAICYEILFSGFIRDYLNSTKTNPHFIINLTNDSWYGDTAEPYQHQQLAFWRAIEFQIPILRMTNTGITSILYPDGTESKRLPIFTKSILDIPFKVYDREPTFYQRWGLLSITGLFLFLILIQFTFEFLSKKEG